MKKFLIVLGMLTCLFGLTACGNSNETSDTTPLMTEAEAIQVAEQLITQIDQIVDGGMVDYYAEDAVASAGLESWVSAMEEMGEFQEILSYDTQIGAEEVTVVADISGTNRNGKVTVVFDGTNGLTSITTTATKTMGELMEGAALNTLLGMGTVFIVLILIMFIISSFSLINKLQNRPKKDTDAEKAVDKTIAQIIENEELADDAELVAVIAAAIAASEGAASTDGFVVRSIKRASSNKWQRA